MDILRKHILLFIVLVATLVAVTACTPNIGNGGSNLTVLQVLQKSADAMKQLKSAHIELKATGSVQGDASSPHTLNMTGSGDEALPDQEQLSLTTNGTSVEEIVSGDKVYVKNASGQWYVLDKSAFKGVVTNPFSGIDANDMNTLLGLLQETQLTDNGVQSLNGENLRHITIGLDKNALKQILDKNQQLAGYIGQANVDAILNNTKKFNASLDLWIDEATGYVHRSEFKLSLNANISSASTVVATTTTGTVTVPSNVTTTFDSVVDLSKFNAPVSITPPTNAIPTDNPSIVFGA
jgi:hypothetical protein